MADMVNVAIDVMGGDYAPVEPIKGAVAAMEEDKKIHVTLLGHQEVIQAQLQQYTYDNSRVTIVDARDVIETAESPVVAIRTKKDSSIVKGMKLVKDGTCDGFVSAGSTGAILVGGQTIVGRLKGVERPPLAPLIPTEKGVSLLIDCGANVDARSSHLLQFAQMGSIYMKHVVGIENPTVGIINNGAEEEKGNALVKETVPKLKECKGINFVGSVEARDIPAGNVDVMVCEAFVGNVVLKLYEGTGVTVLGMVKKAMKSTLKSKIGGLLVKSSLKKTMKSFELDQYGGAPLLGLKGLVVKTHGSANSVAIKQSILQCVRFKREEMVEKIREQLSLEEPLKETPNTTENS